MRDCPSDWRPSRPLLLRFLLRFAVRALASALAFLGLRVAALLAGIAGGIALLIAGRLHLILLLIAIACIGRILLLFRGSLVVVCLPEVVTIGGGVVALGFVAGRVRLHRDQGDRSLEIFLHGVHDGIKNRLHKLRPRRGLQQRNQRRLVVNAIGE